MMLTRADVYGAAIGGKTTDQNTQTAAPASPANAPPSSAAAVANNGPALRGISPLYGGLIVVGGLVGYKLLREWGRDRSADQDVKVALHNGLVVTAFACAGIPLVKGLLNAIATNGPAFLSPVAQPVRDYVLNA